MNAVFRLLGRLGRVVAPDLTRSLGEQRYLSRETLAFRSRIAKTESVSAAVAAVLEHPAFRAEQKPSEIIDLLRMLIDLKPVRLCEVGARRGGTLALFAHVAPPEASILSIDLAFSPAQSRYNPRLGKTTQRIECWSADSHAPELPERVSRWFSSKPIDFLFIDGDHSEDGVRLDYERFSPLVRPGGLIAFHDIVPDAEERWMGRSESYSGGVHRFWNQLKEREPEAIELIDRPNQDGFGIGVVRAR
jgi:predicted O-methyltransferase YrrM